jgi:hypothetical protein
MPMIVWPILFGCVTAFAGPTSTDVANKFRLSHRAGFSVAAVVAVSILFVLSGTKSDFVYRAF